jgi:hypothetical protein
MILSLLAILSTSDYSSLIYYGLYKDNECVFLEGLRDFHQSW